MKDTTHAQHNRESGTPNDDAAQFYLALYSSRFVGFCRLWRPMCLTRICVCCGLCVRRSYGELFYVNQRYPKIDRYLVFVVAFMFANRRFHCMHTAYVCLYVQNCDLLLNFESFHYWQNLCGFLVTEIIANIRASKNSVLILMTFAYCLIEYRSNLMTFFIWLYSFARFNVSFEYCWLLEEKWISMRYDANTSKMLFVFCVHMNMYERRMEYCM